MIFQTQNAIDKILKGEKTQTRRIVKPTHRNLLGYWSDGTHEIISEVYNAGRDRPLYQIGKTYAVQPGRGKPGVVWYRGDNPLWDKETRWDVPCDGQNEWWTPLRIRILAIRREDVRNISEDDARAEGYDNTISFLIAWCTMHDKQAFPKSITPDRYWRETLLAERPADRYDAWALTFEMVK